MLCKLVRHSHIYEAPALYVSSVIWYFKYGEAIEIYNGIIFNFYTGLSHINNFTLSVPTDNQSSSPDLRKLCKSLFSPVYE